MESNYCSKPSRPFSVISEVVFRVEYKYTVLRAKKTQFSCTVLLLVTPIAQLHDDEEYFGNPFVRLFGC